ncbi:hypothetical protein JCM8097_006132 [Rhodosporidiobolus ruineniae]
MATHLRTHSLASSTGSLSDDLALFSSSTPAPLYGHGGADGYAYGAQGDTSRGASEANCFLRSGSPLLPVPPLPPLSVRVMLRLGVPGRERKGLWTPPIRNRETAVHRELGRAGTDHQRWLLARLSFLKFLCLLYAGLPLTAVRWIADPPEVMWPSAFVSGAT